MNGEERLVEVSPEHLRASRDALTELASVMTSPDKKGHQGSPLFVDLVHFEHGHFLSPALRGFPILPYAGGQVEVPKPPMHHATPREVAYRWLAEWAEPEEVDNLFSGRASALLTPFSATEELPFTWATVAGQPVAAQIRDVLVSLTSLLARHAVTPEKLRDTESSLPALLQNANSEISDQETGMADLVARSGWRAAAQELRIRSEQTGRPLRVRYRQTLFDAASLALRAPLLRRAYNSLAPVREAVDRTSAAISRSLHISGDGPSEALGTINDQFEHLGMRQFLAHVVRDSFVCGNGVMVFPGIASGTIRLIPPEQLISVQGDVATIMNGDREERIHRIMHLRGGRQLGSDLGVGMLEPFIRTCADRDIFLSGSSQSRV